MLVEYLSAKLLYIMHQESPSLPLQPLDEGVGGEWHVITYANIAIIHMWLCELSNCTSIKYYSKNPLWSPINDITRGGTMASSSAPLAASLGKR